MAGSGVKSCVSRARFFVPLNFLVAGPGVEIWHEIDSFLPFLSDLLGARTRFWVCHFLK